jgi:protein O-GlcNAc transferase
LSSRRMNVLFQEGVDHHAAGRLELAYAIYLRVIAAEPDHADGHFRLGVLTTQIGRNDLAHDHFKALISLHPREARYHLHLGMVLDTLGRPEEAISSYRAALGLKADYPQAHNNLANTLGRLGRLAEAESHYRAALALNPTMAEAHSNLGHTLNCLGRPAEAETSCRRAMQLRPNYAAALNNLGTALGALGRVEEAEARYRESLGLKLDLTALRNLGNLLAKFRPEDAAQCFREILRLKPDDIPAHKALGDLLAEARRYEEAATCYRAALAVNADLADIWNSLAFVLNTLGRQEEAVECYDEMLRLNPGSMAARVNRCVARLPIIYRDDAAVERAREAFAEELEVICRLREQGAGIEPISGLPPFYLAYQGRSDRDLQARYGGFISAVMSALFPAWASPPAVTAPRPGEKIRVGFLSPFFCYHSNWKIPLKGWLAGLDKSRFEIYGYHVDDKIDEATELAEQLCHRFVRGRGALQTWAETIRADCLHVLVIPGIGLDAMTHRLGALRLAPVQATSWGHPDTTGLPTIDHYLSSELMEPANGDQHYTETLVRLPNLSIAYEPLPLPPAEISRAELGVPEDAVFYWCCQALFKYLPRHDWVFPRIAAAVPQARFVFVEYARGDTVNAVFRERLTAAFAAAGLDWSRHCVLVPPLGTARFGAVSRVADLFLDSLGWSGCNTTFEALANDLPVVTMAGDLMRGRHSAAILTMLGMPDMVAATPEAFIALAIRLGRDPQARWDLRQRIARDKPRLYNDQSAVEGLARYLEDAARSITHTLTDPLQSAPESRPAPAVEYRRS